MSDGVTLTPTHQPTHRQPPKVRPAWRVATVQAVVVVALFAAGGAGAGWVWYQLWDAPEGVVAGGQWYTDEHGLRADFSGVALYVTVAAATGLLLGALAGWRLARSELVTLVAVLAGSVLAAYLMLQVGHHLSPPDPQVVARTAEDGARVDGNLRVDQWPPRGAFPFGGLVGLAVVYAGSARKAPPEVRSPDGTRG